RLIDLLVFLFFFFQAEDGIRDFHVTGVQTCALPISPIFRNRVPVQPPPQTWAVKPIPIIIQPSLTMILLRAKPVRILCSLRASRSEERRVGKECRSRGSAYDEKKKECSKNKSI